MFRKSSVIIRKNQVIFKTNSAIIVTDPVIYSAYPDFFNPLLDWKIMENLEFGINKTRKSTVIGNIHAIAINECAQFLYVPEKERRQETITPIPKVFPPETFELLRPIANLSNIKKN